MDISRLARADYRLGPVVGSNSSLAVVGAYTLAGELATHLPDHAAAFAAYEHALGDHVRRSRAFAVTVAR